MNAAKPTHTPMTSMKWLMRREFWENKGSMFWAPVIVAALLVIVVGGAMTYGFVKHGVPAHFKVNGVPLSHASGNVDVATLMAQAIAKGYMATTAPLFILLAGTVFFYCVSALYDERRDRSILFWKSLPVSDGMTVLSKVATALVLAPLVTLATGTICAFALLLILCTGITLSGGNVFGIVMTDPNLYLAPVALLATLPVYIVWALPGIGWLLLVSSWARTKPMLWAIGVPLLVLALCAGISLAAERITSLDFAGSAFMPTVKSAVSHLLGGIMPGAWFKFRPELLRGTHADSVTALVPLSYASLAYVEAWIGAALGAAMLFGAARQRRWRDEG